MLNWLSECMDSTSKKLDAPPPDDCSRNNVCAANNLMRLKRLSFPEQFRIDHANCMWPNEDINVEMEKQ